VKIAKFIVQSDYSIAKDGKLATVSIYMDNLSISGDNENEIC